MWVEFLYLLIAYLIGSVSTAITLSKIFGIKDPRQSGSNNPGATNMLRVSGKRIAAFTLIGDAFKGFIVLYIMLFSNIEITVVYGAALCAFLGHIYPIYYKFKGGKGVAITLGILLALNSWIAIIALVVWGGVFLYFKYSSLAALVAIIIATLISYTQDIYFGILMTLIAIILIYNHKDNIKRLIKGAEAKINL